MESGVPGMESGVEVTCSVEAGAGTCVVTEVEVPTQKRHNTHHKLLRTC